MAKKTAENTGKSEKPEIKKKVPKKRTRRSPELIIEELDEKVKRLTIKVYKRNASYIQQIGIEMLRMVNYKFSKITAEDRQDITDMTPRGKEMVREIIKDAYAVIQNER